MPPSGEFGSGVPAYRRVADGIARDILSGRLPAGSKLATVRGLAKETGLSQGTVKHIYDVLEREGYLVKMQGSGTFVRELAPGPVGNKARAMEAIDRLLDEMEALSFSLQETRIFLDLKLRQREEESGTVRIAAVDCNPEALAMMKEQIAALPYAEVEQYGLDSLLASGLPFTPQADIVVTTTAHGDALAAKMLQGHEPVRLVMSLAAETAVALAGIDPGSTVGIVCKSHRFEEIIRSGCRQYCQPGVVLETAYLGDLQGQRSLVRRCGRVIAAPHYRLFATEEEIRYLEQADPILYRYEVERGSLVYLENDIKAHHRDKTAG